MVHRISRRSYGIALIVAMTFGASVFATLAQQRRAVPVDDADQPIQTSIQNPNAVAVVIGIGEYQNSDVPKVDFAVNDAEAVRRVLTQTLGYTESRVLVRTNSQASSGRMKPLIRQELKARVVAGQSDVFVYYSGHGAPNADTREGYLIPWDYDPQYIPSSDSAYSLKELYSDLAGLGARSVTVVLEACFSGVSENGALTKDASPLNIVVDNPAQTLTNGTVISASGAREIATWHRDRKHGLMTYYWLLGMRGEAGDAQGRVTPESLKKYLQEKVPAMAQTLKGRKQTPDVVAAAADRVLAQLPVSALRSGDARLVETFGSLEVAIDLGGDLSIDGISQGTIPAGRAFRQEKLSAGPHQIQIRKDGYESIQEQVIIRADNPTRKQYTLAANLPTTPRLDRVYGLIQVSVDRGGSLYIDGKKETDLPPFAPYTTTRIEAGPHRVRVEKQGFAIVDQELLVRPNQTARLDLELKPASAAPVSNSPAPATPPRPSLPPASDAGALNKLPQRFEARGTGIAATKDAAPEIQRQEAFVAAFCVALGEIGEQVAMASGDDRLFASHLIGDFQVTSDTSVDSLLILNDEVTVEYKGQKILVSKGVLKSPVRQLDFPKWNDSATKVAGVEILSKGDRVQTQGTFEVLLAYAP
jgi:hypothetical protein